MRNIKNKPEIYELPQKHNRQELLSEVSKVFSVFKKGENKYRTVYYDSFDWRIYNKDKLLFEQDHTYILLDKSTNYTLAKLLIQQDEHPKFWWQLETSTLRDNLKEILDLRALIPMLSIKTSSTDYILLNKDEKTVIRLCLESVKSYPNKLGNCQVNLIKAVPLRGYEDDLSRLSKVLNSLGLYKTESDYFDLLIRNFDIKPSQYTSKLNLDLSSDMSIQQALIVIFKHLLNTIRQNEGGIKNDIDTEFLHDFRVAVRRTRSALSLSKDLLGKETVQPYRDALSKLGKATNTLRDMDVYLLNKQKYLDMIPQVQHEGLNIIFDKISEQRSNELQKFKRFLNSKVYKKTINDWEMFLNTTEDIESSSENSVKAIDFARNNIYKEYQRIIKHGSSINDDTPDSELHTLRIECKKLRYMLEFFRNLFNQDDINKVVEQLKKLQDNLGDFNDICVQQNSISKQGQKFDSKDSDIKISIGGLIAILYHQQINKRGEFKKTFNKFSNHKNKNIFLKLFKQ